MAKSRTTSGEIMMEEGNEAGIAVWSQIIK
jgi:hypothetical protein